MTTEYFEIVPRIHNINKFLILQAEKINRLDAIARRMRMY